MENQHRKIIGYRELSADEIKAMNGIKNMEGYFNGMIEFLKTIPGGDQRQIALAATHGEEAFMHAVRSIAKPDRKVLVFVPSEPLA